MFSNIEIFPLKDSSGTIKARGRITVSDAININVSIMNGKNGLFVSLPSHKGKDKSGNDKWYSDVFIEDKKIYGELTKKVIDAYEAKVGSDSINQGDAPGPTSQDSGGDSIPF